MKDSKDINYYWDDRNTFVIDLDPNIWEVCTTDAIDSVTIRRKK